MKKIVYLLCACMSLGLMVQAQRNAEGPTSLRFDIPLTGSAIAKNQQMDFQPTLQNLEMPMPGSGKYEMAQKKQALLDNPPQNEPPQKIANVTTVGNPPQLMRNFEGNSYNNRIPNDNDVAISNDGKLISVINSTIWMWDVVADSLIYNIGLEGFSTSLGIPNQKFDPRVMYDPDHDRFVVAFLRGSTDTTSYIMLAFSQSNDPSLGWNFYTLPGVPFGIGEWTDFPMIALTQDEFILTGNLIQTGQPWETGFMETLIWQVDKEDGYNADTLTTQLWKDILYDGKPIRNLRPVKGGSQLYGPNIYFLSNRNFDTMNDTVFIVELTDTIGGNDTVLVNMRISDTPYGFPNNADQKFAFTLATNDCRFLSAFMENDKIQFVGNTRIFGTPRTGIYHGTVDMNNNMAVTATVVQDSLLDYGYPNLAYTGSGPAEDDFILVYNYTDDDSFAGTAAIYYTGQDYSPSLTVRAGDNYITISGFGSNLRWGDYTGCQRVYNEPGKVWFSGLFGKTNRRYGTWIAELGKPLPVGVEAGPAPAEGLSVLSYPNPVDDWVSVEFTLPEAQNMDIRLLDAQGKTIRIFIQDKVKQGRNRFTIRTDDLPQGLYILQVRNDEGVIAGKKIIRDNR